MKSYTGRLVCGYNYCINLIFQLMKKHYFFLLATLLLNSYSFCQNTFPSNGNVGIGTASPAVQLDVPGVVVLAGNNSNIDNRNGNLPLSFLENSGKVLIGWNRTRGAGETDLISNRGGGNVGGFAFYDHANNGEENQLMWLTGDGRLMLGLSTGNTGNNKLAVGGGIIGESVTVKLQGNWPDYVFKPHYELIPLSKVREYIDKNGHLPEVPSAAVIEKEGVNLGEMNKLLMKKVEELTLYLIQLEEQKNKKDLRQQYQINQLSQKLERLSRKIQDKQK